MLDALYVYAIGRRGGHRDADLRGLADAPVETIPVGDLEVIVSRCERASIKPTAETLVRHDAVCTALMAEGVIAPARFGTAFADVESVRGGIDGRQAELRAILGRLEGHVELGVRVVRSGGANGVQLAESGSDYLQARVEERRTGLAAAAEVDERLNALAADCHSRVLETPALLLSASYLVERGAVEAFRDAVEQLDRMHSDLDLVCTGPWPPYSFASDCE